MNIIAAWSGKSAPETSCCRPAVPTGIEHEQMHFWIWRASVKCLWTAALAEGRDPPDLTCCRVHPEAALGLSLSSTVRLSLLQAFHTSFLGTSWALPEACPAPSVHQTADSGHRLVQATLIAQVKADTRLFVCCRLR